MDAGHRTDEGGKKKAASPWGSRRLGLGSRSGDYATPHLAEQERRLLTWIKGIGGKADGKSELVQFIDRPSPRMPVFSRYDLRGTWMRASANNAVISPALSPCSARSGKVSQVELQSEDGGLAYRASAIFGPDDGICALVAAGRFDGDAGSGDRDAASGGAP